jgi:hypothetical protein
MIQTDSRSYDLLVRPLVGGCRLFCMFDCCFSGGTLQLPEKVSIGSRTTERTLMVVVPRLTRQYHFGDTGSSAARPSGWQDTCSNLIPDLFRRKAIDVKVLSCQDDQQVSTLEYRVRGGCTWLMMSQTLGVEKYGKAVELFTWAFLEVVGCIANVSRNWREILDRVGGKLARNCWPINTEDGEYIPKHHDRRPPIVPRADGVQQTDISSPNTFGSGCNCSHPSLAGIVSRDQNHDPSLTTSPRPR